MSCDNNNFSRDRTRTYRNKMLPYHYHNCYYIIIYALYCIQISIKKKKKNAVVVYANVMRADEHGEIYNMTAHRRPKTRVHNDNNTTHCTEKVCTYI